MPTNFQFIPTSGALSGKGFEDQVRQAFNELGGKIDQGNEIADGASQVAEDAKNIANQAVQTVQTAVDAASAAEAAATNAVSKADAATLAANNASNIATQADTNAKLASSTANTALSNSLAAQKISQSAQESVVNMEGQISEISGIAQGAQATANAAAGIYTITPTAYTVENEDGSASVLQFDANNYFDWPQKLYIVAADDSTLPQVPLNLPQGLAMPAWLLVEINGETDMASADPTAVFQSAWDNNATSTYTRVGTTDYTDPDNPVTTWGEWTSTDGLMLAATDDKDSPDKAASPAGVAEQIRNSQQIMHVQDRKAAGVNGGTFTSGWRVRDLNTVLKNTLPGASLSSNVITLPAGTYWVTASAPGYSVGMHQTQLQDVGNSAVLLSGTPEYSSSSNAVSTRSFINDELILTAETTIQVWHYGSATQASNGFGVASISPLEGVFTDIVIRRLS